MPQAARMQESIAANPCSEFSKSDKARPHLNAASGIMTEIPKKVDRVISLLYSPRGIRIGGLGFQVSRGFKA